MLIFLIILLGSLAAGIGALAYLGLSQRRRRLRLAQVAHHLGMRFSASDPFQISHRYGGFVLSSAGHSPLADNVIYGRYEGWNLRAFDYRFEAGHGTQRMVRRYSVIVADTDLVLPRTLLWHAQDDELLPLAVGRACEPAGPWAVVEGGPDAPAVAKAFAEFAAEPVNLQTDGSTVIVYSARRRKASEIAPLLGQVARGLSRLEACLSSSGQ